jgi:hypothetical protein
MSALIQSAAVLDEAIRALSVSAAAVDAAKADELEHASLAKSTGEMYGDAPSETLAKGALRAQDALVLAGFRCESAQRRKDSARAALRAAEVGHARATIAELLPATVLRELFNRCDGAIEALAVAELETSKLDVLDGDDATVRARLAKAADLAEKKAFALREIHGHVDEHHAAVRDVRAAYATLGETPGSKLVPAVESHVIALAEVIVREKSGTLNVEWVIAWCARTLGTRPDQLGTMMSIHRVAGGDCSWLREALIAGDVGDGMRARKLAIEGQNERHRREDERQHATSAGADFASHAIGPAQN